MIDLYTRRDYLGEPMQEAQRRFAERAGSGILGRAASYGAFQERIKNDANLLMLAVNTWNDDLIKNWENQSAELETALNNDLEDARMQAQQARMRNDTDLYKLALDRRLFDRQLKQQKKIWEQARMGQLITGLIQFAGSVGVESYRGISSKKAEKETRRQLWSESLRRDYELKQLLRDLFPTRSQSHPLFPG